MVMRQNVGKKYTGKNKYTTTQKHRVQGSWKRIRTTEKR